MLDLHRIRTLTDMYSYTLRLFFGMKVLLLGQNFYTTFNQAHDFFYWVL